MIFAGLRVGKELIALNPSIQKQSMNTYSQSCQQCGLKFESKRSDARFCSPKCCVYHKRGLKHKPNLMASESKSLPKAPAQKSELKQAAPAPKEPEVITGIPRVDELLHRIIKLKPKNITPIPLEELNKRLFGGWVIKTGINKDIVTEGIIGYNRTQLKPLDSARGLRQNQPWHCTTIWRLCELFLIWGYDPIPWLRFPTGKAKDVGYIPESAHKPFSGPIGAMISPVTEELAGLPE